MKNITTVITKTVDLDAPDMHQQYLARPLVRGNHQAHEFRLLCTRNGAKVDLTGARVWGYVRRQDGVTIPMEGTVEGHIASVVLSSACYVIPGTVMISIDIELNNVRSTHALWRATVLHTQSDLISGDAVLSISESLALVEDAALRAESAAERAAATDAGVLATQVGQLTAQADEIRENMTHKAQRVVYQPLATLTDKYESDISSFYLGAVLDLEMYGANPDKKYSFGTFIRKESYIYITIWDENFTVVCDYNVAEAGAAGKQVIYFAERNQSGVTAKALIDFSVFAVGTSYESLIYQYCGIDSHCYVKTLREKDVASALSTMKHFEKKRGVFKEGATLTSPSGVDISDFLCSAIQDIYISGAAQGETYAIGQIRRDASNEVLINIWNSAYAYVLTAYIADASGYTGRRTLELAELNASGMHGTITVDFDVLTVGTDYSGMPIESTPIDPAHLFGTLREQEIENASKRFVKKRGIFKDSASLTSASGEDISAFLCGAIRDICIEGAKPDETYAIGQIGRDTSNMVDIFVWDSAYTVVLALHIEDATDYTGVRTYDLSALNDSGMTGKITVDFDVLSTGIIHRGMALESTAIDAAYLVGTLREQKMAQISAKLETDSIHFAKKRGIFKESATLQSASGEDISEFLCGAIQDIYIGGAKTGETYAIGQISRDASNVVDIFIWDSAYKIVLALYIADAAGYTGARTFDLSALNDSGMNGKITVDFDVLTAGTNHRGMALESTAIDAAYLHGTLREQKMMQTNVKLESAIKQCEKKKGIFKESATLTSAAGEDISAFLCSAIRDIYIHGAVQGETYAVAQLRWNADNEVMINIWNSAFTYVLAAYIADASGYTGIRTLNLSELSDSGMTGKITVDFDVLTAGTDYSGMPIESTPIDTSYLFGTLRENELESKMVSRRWEGKKWYALGDSFTEQNIYPYYLNEYCKFAEYHNAGWSGHNMKAMLTKLTQQSTSGYDIVTVLCGTNDYSDGTVLGTVADSADTDTFYGHTKKVIETIIGQNPTARLCFFTPMIRGAFENQPVYPALNSAGFGLEAYVDAIRDVCAAYAIPCCDTFRTSQFNTLTLTALTQDNLHPNDVGGKLLARQMQGFIESL